MFIKPEDDVILDNTTSHRKFTAQIAFAALSTMGIKVLHFVKKAFS